MKATHRNQIYEKLAEEILEQIPVEAKPLCAVPDDLHITKAVKRKFHKQIFWVGYNVESGYFASYFYEIDGVHMNMIREVHDDEVDLYLVD